MWPDSPFASPRASFRRPVPVPSQDPDATPTITVTVACSWLPYIRGALLQLLLQSTWDTGNPAVLELAQQRAFNLIDLFQECASAPAISCPFDFSVPGAGAGGFVNIPEPAYTPGYFGQVIDGTGWVSTLGVHSGGTLFLKQIEIAKTFSPAVHMTALEMDFNLSPGVFSSPPPQQGIVAYHSGVQVQSILYNPSAIGAGFHQLYNTFSDTLVDRVEMYCLAGSDTAGDPGGASQITFWGYQKVGGGC